MNIFTRFGQSRFRGAQQRYEQSFEVGGRPGAFGVLRTAEETAEWPPEHVLEWAIRHGDFSTAEVIRFAGALIGVAEPRNVDHLFTLVISEWIDRGPLVDALVTLSLKAGVRPSPAVLENGLKELLKRHPGSAVVNPALLSEIQVRLGLPVRSDLLDEV
jgi:hypothetical protein